ncbi:Holliday junction resolvase RuvX [Prochlorococcus sp. MIT 1300]|uniref:Holliday junction resolvase RuvX n=1 Tax=Prochlorococcus sp. MIT 1300 TaxID=3096218 RepID=UPI002A762489|nr:Holliday junction resolvase RuvX [Prochlorococcus sp. MIT 1300]
MSIARSRSVLAIDVGHKRIGLAGCDPLGISITQLPPLARGKFEEDLERVKLHCEKRKVEGLIIGLPLDENGLITKQAVLCKRYGEKLASALRLPVALVNEHSTTWAANERFNFSKDKSGKLDSACAALMLEQWLREGPELKPV